MSSFRIIKRGQGQRPPPPNKVICSSKKNSSPKEAGKRSLFCRPQQERNQRGGLECQAHPKKVGWLTRGHPKNNLKTPTLPYPRTCITYKTLISYFTSDPSEKLTALVWPVRKIFWSCCSLTSDLRPQVFSSIPTAFLSLMTSHEISGPLRFRKLHVFITRLWSIKKTSLLRH